MPRYVALLRSVNVAGHGRIAMNELRASFAALGFDDVLTYIQTGNVLFKAPSKSESALAAAIEQQLADDFGDSPAVLLRTVPDLLRIGNSSPYAKAGANPARHHVTFLDHAPPTTWWRLSPSRRVGTTSSTSVDERSSCTHPTATPEPS